VARTAELRLMNDDELARHLEESKEELFHLRFQLAMGKQDNSARVVQVRREVARALTLQGERQRSLAPTGHAARSSHAARAGHAGRAPKSRARSNKSNAKVVR